ncbi:MAG: flagellar biosynthetic protein FliR [Nitriliruptoraceae bacterium]
MGVVELPVDAAWVSGLLLAMIRVASFVVTSPLLGFAMPIPARLAFTLALPLALAGPVAGSLELGDLLAAGVVNAAVGGALGWVTGLALQQFSVAGGILDLISGLAVSQVFDPVLGDISGVWNRIFNSVGMTLFVAVGGLGLIASGLWASVRAVPLEGALALQAGGLAGLVVELVADTIRAGVELALPVMGVMLMLELALGIAARFAPQANVFLLGLPAKLLTAITVFGSSWMLFPEVVASIRRGFTTNVEAVLSGFSGA